MVANLGSSLRLHDEHIGSIIACVRLCNVAYDTTRCDSQLAVIKSPIGDRKHCGGGGGGGLRSVGTGGRARSCIETREVRDPKAVEGEVNEQKGEELRAD